MRYKIAFIFLIFFGSIAALAGICFLIDGLRGISDLILISGRLDVTSQAEDDLLDLKDMGPVIFREAEMYQYCNEEVRVSKAGSTNTYHYAEEGFCSRPVSDFEGYESREAAAKLFGSARKYSNPDFPEPFLNENGSGKTTICGTAEIGEEGVLLDPRFLRYFDGESASMEDWTIPAYNTPFDAGEKYGLRLTGDGVYASGNGRDPEIGDLRVTFRVVSPEVLEGDFTAVGRLSEDGHMLLMDESYGAFYRGILTMDEVNRDYKKESRRFGLFCLISALLLFATGAFIR